MSLVRQLAKANAREAERRRVEEEQANRNISIEAIPNTVPTPDVNSDSFHNMTFTETCLGAIDFQRVQDSVAVVNVGSTKSIQIKNVMILENMAANMEPQQR